MHAIPAIATMKTKGHSMRSMETQAQVEHGIAELELVIGRGRSLLLRSQNLVMVLSAALALHQREREREKDPEDVPTAEGGSDAG